MGSTNHMKSVLIYNLSMTENQPIRTKVCDQFSSRLRGLMFSKELKLDEGLLFVHPRESRMDASIHMLFMFYDLAIIWINSRFEVVDTTLAKKWRPIYVPSAPAFYTLEAHTRQLNNFKIGNKLEFHDA